MSVMAGDGAVEPLAREPSLRRVPSVLPGRRWLARMISRIEHDRAVFRADRPDVLITDGDAPSSIVAASMGVPVVAVGHGLVFAHCDAGPLPVLPHLREALNALSSSLLADARVAVHFGHARPRRAGTRVARADVSSRLDRQGALEDRIVAYFRDGGGDAWLEALVEAGENVVLFAKRSSAPRGVELRAPDARAFAESLAVAKGAVGTAGSNLIAECAYLGVPLLALPAEDDVEQRLNARMLEHVGIGVAASLGTFDPSRVRRFRASASAVLESGRRGNLLPHAPGVAESVVSAVNEVVLRAS